MAFKNINTAINQELGLISAQQHSYINRKCGRQVYNNSNTGKRSIFDEPLEFEPWLLKGMNYYYEKDGTEFETVSPGLMRIKLKNGKAFLRTLEDFKREHEEYKANYYL